MDKNQLLAVEQNLTAKQQELAQMQIDIEQHKSQLDSQTAQELSARVGTLYKEYATLKQQVAVLQSNDAVYQQLRNANVNKNQTTTVKHTVQVEQERPRKNNQTAQKSTRTPIEPKLPKPKRDLEKALGKNVMGVMASILIFVALILFAVVALPNMTDTIKMIGMFVISGGITAVGVMLMHRDQRNAFNASIAGCGIGAVFISLMTTRMYFNAINDYVLYVALLLWVAAIAFFSQNKQKVFVIIAEVGISIATFIGLAGLFADPTAAELKTTLLLIFALLSECAIYYFNSNRNMKDDIFMHLSHVTRTLVMFMVFLVMADEQIIRGIPLMMIAFIAAGLYLLNSSDGNFGKNFILTIYVLPILFTFNNYAVTICTNAPKIEPYVILFGAAIIYHIYTYVYNDYKFAVGASHIALIACSIYFMGEVACQEKWAILAILIPAAIVLVPIALMADYTKERYWRWLSAGLPVFFALLWFDMGGLKDIEILAGFIVAVIYVAMNFYILDEAKDDKLRICLYFASLFVLPLLFGSIIDEWTVQNETTEAILNNISMMCSYVPMIIIYLWADKSDYITREKDISVLQNILMGFLVCIGCVSLHDGASDWKYESYSAAYAAANIAYDIQSWVIGFALIGLNAMRTIPMLNKGKRYGIWVAAAYTVTTWAIVTRISEIDYIVSIVMLLLAIGLIIMGFKINLAEITGNKEMRLFGLILSMIVTVKLLMIDIEHNNLLETSGYFLLAGALCFAISFAYNRLDKSLSSEQLAIDSECGVENSIDADNDAQ